MRAVRTIAMLSLFTMVAIVVEIAFSSWPPAFPPIAGIVAAGAAFASVLYGLMTALEPERRLTIAVVCVLAGSAGGAAWWLVSAKETTLPAALGFGGAIALLGFIEDSWSIQPAGAAAGTGRQKDGR
jgi:hypothetical protein